MKERLRRIRESERQEEKAENLKKENIEKQKVIDRETGRETQSQSDRGKRETDREKE